MIINGIYEHQNLLSLYLVSFLVQLRTYQHPCINEHCLEVYLFFKQDSAIPMHGEQLWPQTIVFICMLHIQGVPGGTDQTSGGCSLC